MRSRPPHRLALCVVASLLPQCTGANPSLDAAREAVALPEDAREDSLEVFAPDDGRFDGGFDAGSEPTAVGSDASAVEVQTSIESAVPCPEQWLAAPSGGCGPAVFLCADGSVDGCETLALPRTITEGDSGVQGTSFYRTAEGSIGGGWSVGIGDAAAPSTTWTPNIAPARCADGWRRTNEQACEPVFSTTCAVGSIALPNNTCTRTAEQECPTTEFSALPPEATGAPVRYVSALASQTGDGSMARPFRTIQEALAGAPSNTWIFLGRGTYSEPLSITTRMHLVGVCSRFVTLASSGTIQSTSSLFDLRTVLLDGSLAMIGPGTLSVDRVRLFRGSITVSAGQTATLTEVYGIRAQLRVQTGGRATLRNSVLDTVLIEGTDATGSFTNSVLRGADSLTRSGGTLSLVESVLLETAARAESNGTITVANSAVLDAPLGALSANGENARVSVSDTLVRGTRARPSASSEGRALSASQGGQLTATRVLVTDGQGYGVYARDANTRITLDAVRIQNTAPAEPLSPPPNDAGVASPDVLTTDAAPDGAVLPPSFGTVAGGLRAESGASILGSSVLLTNNSVASVAVLHEGSSVSLSESALRSTVARAFDQQGGSGVEVSAGGLFSGARVLVSDSTGVSILSSGAGRTMPSRVVLQNSVLRSTRARRTDGSLGIGLMASYGASIEGANLLLTDHRMAGIYATEAGTVVRLRDSAIRNTTARGDGTFGSGIELARGALFRGQRLLLENNTEFGISVFQSGTTAELSQVLLRGVVPSRAGFGLGVAVYGGAQLNATALAVENVRGAGLASVPYESTATGLSAGSFLRSTGTFVRNVTAGTVRFNSSAPEAGTDRMVSYGLHVGTDCVLQVSEFLVESSGYGFFHSGGTLLLHHGVFARQQTLGAANGASTEHPFVLEEVGQVGNERTEVLSNVDLPSASIDRPARPNIVLPEE